MSPSSGLPAAAFFLADAFPRPRYIRISGLVWGSRKYPLKEVSFELPSILIRGGRAIIQDGHRAPYAIDYQSHQFVGS